MQNLDLREKKLREVREDLGRGGCGILGVTNLNNIYTSDLLQQAIQGLINMEHRGGSLNGTGDGAGLLIGTERSFFERFIGLKKRLPSKKEPLIVGNLFFLRGERNIINLQREIDVTLLREGLAPLGWRRVPVNPDVLGSRAKEDVPQIYQILLAKGLRRESQLDEVLHRMKVMIEEKLPGLVNVNSLSPHTTVYKALATAEQLSRFYLDLTDSDLKTNVVVAHRRFSTNTFSNWNLVQPFRHIAHNGEINSITANCRAVKDAGSAISVLNTLMNHGSDSAQFDRVAEILSTSGMSGIAEAIRRMVPPVWNEHTSDESERQFFEANSRALGTIGAWEGPLAMVATDGKYLLGTIDRMGLRPLRYVKTYGGLLVISSEIGAINIAPEDIEEDGSLEPGDMVIADLKENNFVPPSESTRWIIEKSGLNFKNLATVDLVPLKNIEPRAPFPIKTLNAFGWTKERISNIKKMIKDLKEPIYGMGNDRPLAIFSENNSRLYSFLHQIVAVVTNPPIDPIREGSAIDTTVLLGRSPIISRKSTYKSWPQYKLEYPILTNDELGAIENAETSDLNAHKLDATFKDKGKSREIIRRIHDITDEAISVIRSKRASILILSDFAATKGERLPLPMLLVVSALHQALAEKGLRRDASIIVETGEVQEGHDLAILLAYGATAVNPYAIFNIARHFADVPSDQAIGNIIEALIRTLKRVMSKMGITTFTSYRGSALFEAVGISSDVVEYYIPDTVSHVGGLTIDDIYNDIVTRCSNDSEQVAKNRNISIYRKEVVNALQLVARSGNSNGDYDKFITLLKDTPPVYLRDILDWNSNYEPLAPDQVTTAEEIIKRVFRGAAMSHGALNSTAHRAIAAAFNHFGSMSNCGEGGEDERRNPNGSWSADRSRSRQIASGRFGVDANYLVHADEIEIKIGQGAKPGEGGHLPGHKVAGEIAKIRKTREGITLISPPPHHDIYSIEDLAALITHLRQLHPKAVIAVKVPSITALGTIAVGIAKAGADVITISGYSGGTGAASFGSIKHAGLPLERGVSEVHQYLSVNGLRRSISIRADGGIKSGQDIAKIMALGANEITIGTPLLIAENCIFCRGCSSGNCPVGITTLDKEKEDERFMQLRLESRGSNHGNSNERYIAARDGIIRYLDSLASEFKTILATLRLSDPKMLVGRVDLLEQKETGNERWDRLDLSDMLIDLNSEEDENQEMPTGGLFDRNSEILSAASEILSGESGKARIDLSLTNRDHSIGASLAGEISKRELQGSNIKFDIDATGYAGQGFGFGATSGMNLRLKGYANDGAGTAMSGSANITIIPSSNYKNINTPHLVGNAAAYGATGGKLFVAGKAGQRFGVRNSGATLVSEGVGKYAFEYMTGGIGVVLGRCGPVVGSGMTGGILFIYDPDKKIKEVLHRDITTHYLDDESQDVLKRILVDYKNKTESEIAGGILRDWSNQLQAFAFVKSEF